MRSIFSLDRKITQNKIIHKHAIAQRVVLLFSPNILTTTTSLTKAVEIMYAIQQGLSKRRLYKKYVRRNVTNGPGVNLR